LAFRFNGELLAPWKCFETGYKAAETTLTKGEAVTVTEGMKKCFPVGLGANTETVYNVEKVEKIHGIKLKPAHTQN
jgi:hypothetical protein